MLREHRTKLDCSQGQGYRYSSPRGHEGHRPQYSIGGLFYFRFFQVSKDRNGFCYDSWSYAVCYLVTVLGMSTIQPDIMPCFCDRRHGWSNRVVVLVISITILLACIPEAAGKQTVADAQHLCYCYAFVASVTLQNSQCIYCGARLYCLIYNC